MVNQSGVSPEQFESLRIYETPEVLLTQLLDDELTFGSIQRTLFRPSRLSPEERDSYVERLKRAQGIDQNPLASTLVDVATNPFVWMLFVTSSPGAKVMAQGMRAFSGTRFAGWLKERAPILHQLGFATVGQVLRGNPATEAALEAHDAYRSANAMLARAYGKEYHYALEKLGLATLDPHYVLQAGKREVAEEVSKLLWFYHAGVDKTLTRLEPKFTAEYYRMTKEGKRVRINRPKNRSSEWETWAKGNKWTAPADPAMVGRVDVELKKVVYPAQTEMDLEVALERLGAAHAPDDPKFLVRLARAMQDTHNTGYELNFGTGRYALEGVMEVDPRKSARVLRSQRNKILQEKGMRRDAGVNLAVRLTNGEALTLIESGAVSEAQYLDMIRKAVDPKNTPWYSPRNVLEVVNADRIRVDPEIVTGIRNGRLMAPAGATIPRIPHQAKHIHTDDLLWLRKNYGLTDAGERRLAAGLRYVEDATKRGGLATMVRANAGKAFDRHVRGMAETAAWHGAPTDRLARVWTMMWDEVPAETKAQLANRRLPGGVHGRGIPLSENPFKVPWEKQPPGGLSRADLLWIGHQMTRSKHGRAVIEEVMIPGVVGRPATRHLVAAAMTARTQDMATWFTGTGLGRAMRKMGPGGEKLIQGLENFAKMPVGEAGPQHFTRGLAKWLYVSHLGLNLPSTILNMMQPWLLSATWIGPMHILKGYERALGEMYDYTMAQARMGGRPLTRIEHVEEIGKHFTFAKVGAVYEPDLIGITPDIFEAMGGIILGSTGAALGKESFIDKAMQMMMMPFSRAEWLNRSVTAHAVVSAYGERAWFNKAQRVLRPEVEQTVRQAVQETQFGAQFMNTPIMFLSDHPMVNRISPMFTNALMRMFFTFPLRSATALLETSKFVAGGRREWGLLGIETTTPPWAVVHDVMRSMAISAVGYEMFKGLIGADLSRGLFAEATTDILGGAFREEGGRVMMPPVVSLGADAVKFLGSGDLAVFRDMWPRMFPGGIAAARALNIAPELPGAAGHLQHLMAKRYANWENMTPDGMVPVFLADGRLIDMRSPTQLVLEGLGADLGRWRDVREMEGWLINNRDEMIELRREYIRYLLGGDVEKAQGVAREHMKRFGIPLTVGKDQVEAALKLRMQPRPERLLDRMPPEARAIYAERVAATMPPGSLGIPNEMLYGSGSPAGSRNLGRPVTMQIDPVALQALQAAIQEKELFQQRP